MGGAPALTIVFQSRKETRQRLVGDLIQTSEVMTYIQAARAGRDARLEPR
jgi:hypothetical protein